MGRGSAWGGLSRIVRLTSSDEHDSMSESPEVMRINQGHGE